MRLNHVGIAVESLAVASRFWAEAMGLAGGETELVEGEGIRVRKFPVPGGPAIELMEEAAGEGGVIAKFLAKRGPGVHHLSFEVDDLDRTIARFRALGYRTTSEQPRAGAGGARVTFLHPKDAHGVLVELLERPRESP